MGIASGGDAIGISLGDGTEVSAIASSSAPVRRMDEYEEEAVPESAAEQQQGYRGSSLVDPVERAYMSQRKSQGGPTRGSIFLSGAVLAALGSAVYLAVKAYYQRQEDLVKLFGSEMSYYVGDLDAMTSCAKTYKRKLGPAQFREEMFREFLLQLGRKKPVTASVMQSVAHAANIFRFKEAKLAKLLVKVGEVVPRKQPGVRSKLLFYGRELCRTTAAKEALKPLEAQMAANYRSGGEAIVNTMLTSMKDQALRDSITAANSTVLPGGWELLGLSQEEAESILAEFSGAAGAATSAAAGNDASWREFYATPPESKENAGDDDEEGASLYQQLMEKAQGDGGEAGGASGVSGAKSFECQECGYTLFVAKGREWKFFGDDFKCPECGAAKDKFTERQSEAAA